MLSIARSAPGDPGMDDPVDVEHTTPSALLTVEFWQAITTACRRGLLAGIAEFAATLEAHIDQTRIDNGYWVHEPNDPRGMCRHHEQQIAEPRAWGYYDTPS